ERAVAAVVTELEPTGLMHGPPEPCLARAVVEIGHGTRAELASQAACGAPQLGLFRGVAGIHRMRIVLLPNESQVAKARRRPIISRARRARRSVLCHENTATIRSRWPT